MDLILLAVAGALTLGAGVITVIAYQESRAAQRSVRAMRLALAVAEQRADDEESRKESAMRLLEEHRIGRLTDYQIYRAKLETLETQYADTLRLVAADKLVPFKRLH